MGGGIFRKISSTLFKTRFGVFSKAADWCSPIIVYNVFCIQFLSIDSIDFIV